MVRFATDSAAGAVYEIAVKGPVVSKAYYNRPESNALAKIHDPRDGGLVHRLGEHAVLGRNGRTLEMNDAFIYRFDDGRIREMWFIAAGPAEAASFWA